MNYQKILLALRDGEELGIFTGFLADQGFDVSVATDGATALELAIGTHPALVITDPELGVISGERVFQIIRHNPNTARIPFLFISDNVSDIKGFHTGVDVFLLRPLNLDEVRARVTRTLRSGGPLPAAESTDMEGRLSHISIADILQFMQLNSKEGELLITSGATVGKIYVKDGQVYNSVTGGVEKEKALFRLLTLDEGKFEFIPRQISIARKIKGSTGSVLMEGMRQLDEYRKNRDKLPDPELTVAPASGAHDPPADLAKPVYNELLKLTGQYNTIADLIEHCSWPDYEAHSALSTLLARGILRRRSESGGRAASTPAVSAVDSDGELVVARAGGDRPENGTAETGGGGPLDADVEFLTTDQAISIREKIITRFADTMNLTFARILLVGTGGAAVAAFLRSLKRTGGVRINHRAASLDSAAPVPVGEVATYRLYGGMDLVFVSVPSVRYMGPVYTAFSTNLVGVILLFDDAGARELKGLAEAKHELSAGSMVPLAHIYLGANPGDDDASFFKKTLDLKADEPLFTLSGDDRGGARDALYSIFSKLLKEEVFLTS